MVAGERGGDGGVQSTDEDGGGAFQMVAGGVELMVKMWCRCVGDDDVGGMTMVRWWRRVETAVVVAMGVILKMMTRWWYVAAVVAAGGWPEYGWSGGGCKRERGICVARVTRK
ncbi:hypothetical protein Tco_1292938 [Tanacetum coccineum]